MDKLYFTITGTKYRFGTAFMKPEMKVTLKKEPDNEYDPEAICVSMEGLGKVGYVANSPHTIQGKSLSAVRLYDKIGDEANGTILYVLPEGVLCAVDEASILHREELGRD